MKVLTIIDKDSKDRTKEELQYCFDVFTKKDNTVSNLLELKDIPDFNKVLDNLRLLSKSRLQLFNYCPFKFKCQYLLKFRIDKESEIMIAGKNLHLINEEFWKSITGDSFFNYRHTVKEFITMQYMQFIPKNVKLTTFEEQMIQNFITFETNRIEAIFHEMGFSHEIINKYVKPIITELPIENWEKRLMGIIDRGDHLTNEANALLEYKYGKPKYFDTWKEDAIIHELAFYNILVQGNAMAVKQINNEDVLVPLKEILGFEPKFYYGAMIFFQDFENTAKLFKIKNINMIAVKNQIKKFWDTLETGKYYPKPNNSCYEWCEYYWGICENNPCWKEIENIMESEE